GERADHRVRRAQAAQKHGQDRDHRDHSEADAPADLDGENPGDVLPMTRERKRHEAGVAPPFGPSFLFLDSLRRVSAAPLPPPPPFSPSFASASRFPSSRSISSFSTPRATPCQ